MESTYKIDFVHQVKSLRYVLIGLIAFIILFYIITYQQRVTLELIFFVGLPIPLLLFGPAIYLHLDYLFENYGVFVSVDPVAKSFVITKNGKRYSYKFSDIISLEQHLGIYIETELTELEEE